MNNINVNVNINQTQRKMNNNRERYRFAIPKADKEVNNWLKNQTQFGVTLRNLIKEYIDREGITDPTCRPIKCTTNQTNQPKTITITINE